MISYQAVLVEIEKHLQAAKVADSEQQFRDSMVAMKALCDVVLKPVEGSKRMSMDESKVTVVNSEIPPTLTSFQTTQKLEEKDGANGISIFDF